MRKAADKFGAILLELMFGSAECTEQVNCMARSLVRGAGWLVVMVWRGWGFVMGVVGSGSADTFHLDPWRMREELDLEAEQLSKF
nr:hypothetical protein Iba_chr02bCG25280 [Ipomoea batatas]